MSPYNKSLIKFQSYTSTIAAAIALITSSPTTQLSEPVTFNNTIAPTISKAELKGKNDLERAALVWNRYGHLIKAAAEEYDLDPNLIFATIMVESGGDTYAIRHEPKLNDASYGLGQILYSTARGIGYRGKPEGLYDPKTNIYLIAKYHKRNFDRYQELNALELTTAYNTGNPYKRPHPGHLTKFNNWYNSLANLEIDLS